MTSGARAFGAAAVVVAALVGPGIAGPVSAAGTVTQLSLEADLLTLEADDAPLADVLRRLADQDGVKVIGRPSADVRISARLERVPLDEALKRLLRDVPYIASYEARPNSRVLVEIRFLGAGADAATATGGGAPARSTDWVARAATSPERSARVRAIQMLQRQRTREATETLIGLMRDDHDAVVRERAAAALAEMGAGREVVGALTVALSDGEPFVRVQAVRGVARVEGEAAADTLIRMANGDPSPPVRRAAIEALARWPGDRVREALTRATSDTDPATRELARDALARTRSPSPANPRAGR